MPDARPLMHDEALRVATGESRSDVRMNRVDEIGMTLRTINQLGLMMFRWLVDDVSEQVLNVQRASNEIAQQQRPERAHRAGVDERADGRVDGRDDRNRVEQCGDGAAGEPVVGIGERRGRARRAGGERVVATMNDITASSRKISTSSRDRRHRVPDQHPCAERRGGGGAGRRSGGVVSRWLAGEVRRLRNAARTRRRRSRRSARDVERVESGARIVDGAGKTMEDIVTQVKRVSDLIAEISSSTAEQSTGLQVDQAARAPGQHHAAERGAGRAEHGGVGEPRSSRRRGWRR